MISEQRKKTIELVGETRSDELREILKRIIVQNWEQPNLRFSPLMLEHLLYFISKSIPFVSNDLFTTLVSLKFAEEYGYKDYSAIIPKLVEDLVAALRIYCIQHFQIDRIAPQRAIEKVFREPILLYLDGYPINSQTKESIRDISGLPVTFLSDFFQQFDAFRSGQSLSEEMECQFGTFFRSMCSDYAL